MRHANRWREVRALGIDQDGAKIPGGQSGSHVPVMLFLGEQFIHGICRILLDDSLGLGEAKDALEMLQLAGCRFCRSTPVDFQDWCGHDGRGELGDRQVSNERQDVPLESPGRLDIVHVAPFGLARVEPLVGG